MTQAEVKIEKLVTGINNIKRSPRKQNGRENDEEENEIRKKWKTIARHEMEAQLSWELIDGSVEDIRWSSADDCWRWSKRFLTIGNIGVIAVCVCLLMGTSYVCSKR